METRRLVLLMIFSLSLIMLWDNYQASKGQPTVFGMPVGSSTQAGATPTGSASLPPSVANSAVPGANPASSSSPADIPSAGNSAQAAGVAAALPAQGAMQAAAHLIEVNTDVLALQFSTQGGQLVGSRLLKHPAANSPDQPTQLFEQSANRLYVAQSGVVGVEGAPNHRTLFEVVEKPNNPSTGPQVLKLRAVSGGVETLYTYTMQPGRYDVGFDVQVKNLGEQPLNPVLYMQISRDAKPLASDSKLYSTFTGPAVYTPEGKYQKVSFDDVRKQKASYTEFTEQGWVAMVQHYFVSALVPMTAQRYENFVRQVDQDLFAVGFKTALGSLAPQQAITYKSLVYTGPQDQRVLEKLAPGLDLVVDYGWLTVVAQPIYWLLEKIHAVVGSWGWAIVLLTLLIKLAFFPLSAASYRSMAKMRTIAPRMQQLKQQHGDDRMGFQRAMMDMYKREKINPLGGCMPILVQIPVFIALYWVLLASVEMRNAPWYWITDLAAPDDSITRFLPWDFGVHVGVLPIIMAITMFIQTKLNPTPPDPMQAKIMMIMPLAFSVMFVFFPAGLVLYWVVNNILSIAQQWTITRQIEAKKS